MKAKKFAISALLNKPGFHSTAAIAAHVKAPRCYNKKGRYIDGTITISDCIRAIDLDVSGTKPEDYDNALYKIDTLISVLTEFRKAYVKARKQTEAPENRK